MPISWVANRFNCGRSTLHSVAVPITKHPLKYEQRQLHGFCDMLSFVAPHFVVTVGAYLVDYHSVRGGSELESAMFSMIENCLNFLIARSSFYAMFKSRPRSVFS